MSVGLFLLLRPNAAPPDITGAAGPVRNSELRQPLNTRRRLVTSEK